MWTIDVQHFESQRFSLVKQPVVCGLVVVLFIAFAALPGLFYDSGGTYLDSIVPNLTTELAGVVITLLLVDYLLSRARSSSEVTEINKLLASALDYANRFVVSMDSKLETTSLIELSTIWIKAGFNLSVVEPSQAAEIIDHAKRLYPEYREPFVYEAKRCRDLAVAFAQRIPATEVAALSHHAYTLEFLWEELRADQIDSVATMKAILSLVQNLHVLSEQLSIESDHQKDRISRDR